MSFKKCSTKNPGSKFPAIIRGPRLFRLHEPAAPLPRLGRSLALIQNGDLIAGRQQLELAVALDPTNALTRSYMAKVYETENRAKLTDSQIDLAKRFDPLDPTPWLYAALQKLRANRPVEAFQDLDGLLVVFHCGKEGKAASGAGLPRRGRILRQADHECLQLGCKREIHSAGAPNTTGCG